MRQILNMDNVEIDMFPFGSFNIIVKDISIGTNSTNEHLEILLNLIVETDDMVEIYTVKDAWINEN
jgi:hypothetical protein